MENQLIRLASGEAAPTYRDRAVSKVAKQSYDEVRLKALQADGAFALAGHIMQSAMELDERRRDLAAGNPVVDLMLIEFEANALRQAKAIQNGLYDRWGL